MVFFGYFATTAVAVKRRYTMALATTNVRSIRHTGMEKYYEKNEAFKVYIHYSSESVITNKVFMQK
jgi:hypothetical protein